MKTNYIIGIIVIIVIVVGGIFLIGRDGTEGDSPLGSESEDGSPITSSVPANNISTIKQEAGESVTVSSVIINQSGYLVVHKATEEDTPGEVIGNSALLPQGGSSDIKIELSESVVDGDVLFLMLHSDDGNGIYEFPGPDTPVIYDNGSIEMVRIVIGEEVTEANNSGVDEMIVNEEQNDTNGVEDLPKETSIEMSGVIIVTYTKDGFNPKTIEVSVGDTVRWVNEGDRNMWVATVVHPTHTIYPEKSDTNCLGSSFDACIGVAPGDAWEFTFDEEGSWDYHNHLRASRVGTIEVN